MFKCENCGTELKSSLEAHYRSYGVCPKCGSNWVIKIEAPKPEQEIPEIDNSIKERLEEIKEDLMDDGKLNYSNDKSKKSPGRKPKRGKK